MSSLDKPVRARASVQESGHSRDLQRPPLPEPLPSPVIDTHCHLDINDGWPGDEGDEGAWLTVSDALERAASVGVSRIVQVGCDLPSARWSADCAEQHDAIIATVALHPNEAPRIFAEGGRAALEAALEEISTLAERPRVRAIGETGMDFFRTGDEGRAIQEESFRRHIDLAKRLGKPVVIHDRESHEAVIEILESEGAPENVVFHCYSGDADMARYCTERGWYLSFAGTVTFKNAQALRDSVAVAPLDRILVETDAPYLTPSPYRGRPNASYLIPHTARVMAQSADVDEATMSAALWDNAQRVFGAW